MNDGSSFRCSFFLINERQWKLNHDWPCCLYFSKHTLSAKTSDISLENKTALCVTLRIIYPCTMLYHQIIINVR